ncbi:MAG: CBS domain-containing protein [Bdellovibrionota bacterium]
MKVPSIEENMSRPMSAVDWNYPIIAAWKLMKDCKVRHLPVYGEDGALAGILSDTDISRAVDPEHARFDINCTAEDFMKSPVLTVDQESPLVEVLDTMIQQKVSSLVVTKNSSIVGIITSEDLLKILRKQLGSSKEKALNLSDLFPFIQEAIREAGAAGI